MQPTPEWGPAGRPCASMNTDRYSTSNNTYDCVSNTRILLNGIPTENVHINDNFANDFQDEMLQLWERVSASRNENDQQTSTHQTFRGEPEHTSPIIIVSNKDSGQKPGPSILKISKQNQQTNKSKIANEISPSKQPLIGPELEYPSQFVSESIPAETVKTTATKGSSDSRPVSVVEIDSKLSSSGREKTSFSTFGKTSTAPGKNAAKN